MFQPISNYDLSWPDPDIQSNDTTQKYLQCMAQYTALTSSVNDSTVSGTVPTSTSYGYVRAAIAPNGIIAIGNLFASAPAYYNTNTDSSAAGVGITQALTPAYSPYDNRFYFVGSTFGIRSISADDTGSAYTTVGTGFTAASIVPYGNKLYFTALSAGGTIREWNIDTQVLTTIGTLPFGAENGTVAPNGLIVYSGETNVIGWFDPTNNTSGSMSGTTASDNSYKTLLASDGYIYTGAQFNATTIWRIDPYKKTVTSVFSGAPLTSSQRKRIWTNGPDGNIYFMDGNASNALYSYNPLKNQISLTPITYQKGTTDRNYLDAVCSKDAMYLIPSSTGSLVRFNNTGNKGEKNDAWVASQLFK